MDDGRSAPGAGIRLGWTGFVVDFVLMLREVAADMRPLFL